MIWDTVLKILAVAAIVYYALVISVVMLFKTYLQPRREFDARYRKEFWKAERITRARDGEKYTADVPPGGP